MHRRSAVEFITPFLWAVEIKPLHSKSGKLRDFFTHTTLQPRGTECTLPPLASPVLIVGWLACAVVVADRMHDPLVSGRASLLPLLPCPSNANRYHTVEVVVPVVVTPLPAALQCPLGRRLHIHNRVTSRSDELTGIECYTAPETVYKVNLVVNLLYQNLP